jgi:predicted nucleic-acid-binding protein
MMRVLIDANVLIDALLDEEDRPQGDRLNAQLVLEAVARGELIGVITPVILSFVIHVIKPRKVAHRKKMEDALGFLMDICEWAPVTPDHYRTAMASSFTDVEDGMEFFAAGGTSLSAVITRNVADFKDHVPVAVLTPSQFAAKHLK